MKYKTVNQRVKHIADVLYDGNITAMAKATFIRRTTLNSIIGENEVSPGYEVLRKIADISSCKISMEWLIRGIGDMLLGGEKESITGANNVNSKSATVIGQQVGTLSEEFVRDLLAEKDRQIKALLEIIGK